MVRMFLFELKAGPLESAGDLFSEGPRLLISRRLPAKLGGQFLLNYRLDTAGKFNLSAFNLRSDLLNNSLVVVNT